MYKWLSMFLYLIQISRVDRFNPSRKGSKQYSYLLALITYSSNFHYYFSALSNVIHPTMITRNMLNNVTDESIDGTACQIFLQGVLLLWSWIEKLNVFKTNMINSERRKIATEWVLKWVKKYDILLIINFKRDNAYL